MEAKNVPWSRKYVPGNTGEIYGQREAVKSLLDFISSYTGRSRRKRAALLHGPVGCGKTSAVHAVAGELGLEVVETNASDFRNESGIESIAGQASRQMSLFGKGKIILIDEIDGLAGREDRGGVGAVQGVIEKSAFPVVMTANDVWNKKLSQLRKKALLVEFLQLDTGSVRKALARVCQLENIEFDEEAMSMLANRSAGDLRGAITDLQLLCAGKQTLEREAVNELSERNRTEAMKSAILRIFKTTDISLAVSAFEKVEEQPEQCFEWIKANLPLEYEKHEELAEAYDALSKADVFRGRIIRRQYWRLLSYFIQLMTAGTALAKKAKYPGTTEYKQPDTGLKIYIARAKHQKKLDIAEKIALKTHSTRNAVLRQTLPLLKKMFENSAHEESIQLAAKLDIDDEEIAWLRKQAF